MVYTYTTRSAEETEALGRRIGEWLLRGGVRRAFLSLYGEMGVGKTALTRGFAAALGIAGVKSPTYTMVNEHRSPDGSRSLFHFDLYRIESEDDLWSIGFEDYLKRNGFCVTEWSENAPAALPPDRLVLRIDRTADGEDCRRITLSAPDDFPCGPAAAFPAEEEKGASGAAVR